MKLNLKHRHLLTSAGNIRLKYVVGICALFILLGGWMFSGDDNQTESYVATVIETPTAQQPEQATYRKIEWGEYDPEIKGQGVTPFLSRIGTRPYFNKPYAWAKTLTVESGDALGLLMEETGLHGDDYVGAMTALKKHVDPTEIKPGHKIQIINSRLGDKDTIKSISYIYDGLTSVQLTNPSGQWIAEKKETPLLPKIRGGVATIENSIYGSMGKAGIPDGIINKMIKAYSWTVDFQRDIWGDEEVEVLYETRESEDGEVVRSSRLLYANLKLRGRDLPIYLFEKDKGFPNYFEPSGQSIRRALMKTPIDGARLSSGYGMRTHPVLGYKKAHKGVDFAAPTGTPIYAAGDGVVQRANRFSSFGNYIKIKHNETYQTAYAHLNGFAKGIRSGTRVKQGQVIGYVGTTGRSTGPHLHYEVHKNGVKVNPHSVKLPLGEQLKGDKLDQFRKVIKERSKAFQSITGVMPGQNSNMVRPTKKPKV